MKLPTIPFYKIERVIRVLPIVKDVFTAAPIESDYRVQLRKLDNIIHNKNAEIFKLRQHRKSMKRLLFSNNEKIKDLEKNLKNCVYELNILNNGINNIGEMDR